MDQRAYLRMLDEQVAEQYKIAGAARAKGFDPSREVEALPTRNLAERVEGLVGPKYIADEIKKAQEEGLSREKIVERIIDWILKGTYLKDQDKQQRIEQALRTALAILTEGVVSAPLEGISKVTIDKNPDGSDYLSIYFAGPIRGAGGTAAALSVLLGDYIRRKVGVSDYRPTDTEIERYKEEIKIYHRRVVRLQYMPTDEEIELIMRNVPVCIDGDPTEKREVDLYKGLERIKTDRIRGGMCLVIGEGIAQKYKKVLKFAEGIGLEGWDWLKDMKKTSAGASTQVKEIRPNKKFLEDIVAGRPIFAYPSRPGAFRLRYGRSNMCGIASKAIHPATMEVLGEFPVTGTQMRVERPGKGMIAVPCAEMEGPVIKDNEGSVRILKTVEEAKEAQKDLAEILSLGDILVSFGDFLNSNETLPPSGYVEEWWEQEYVQKGGGEAKVDGRKAVEISESLGIPLHPKYTPPWHDITVAQLKRLNEWMGNSLSSFSWGENRLVLKNEDKEAKRVLELLLVPHTVSGEEVVIDDYAIPLLVSMGLIGGQKLDFTRFYQATKEIDDQTNAFQAIQELSPIPIRRKVGCYIGARMGRPEKARERKMEPPPQVLFPVSEVVGNTRSVDKAVKNIFVRTEVARMRCAKCKKLTFLPTCPDCKVETQVEYKCSCGSVGPEKDCPRCKRERVPYEMTEVPIKGLMALAESRVKRKKVGELKGVRGMTSAMKIPEPLEKGILRANNGVFVFKDGSIRYDGTDIPTTHFRPKDIAVPVERLKELGYEKDVKGEPLEKGDQIVALLAQDVIIPKDSAEYMTGICNFIDDLLEQFYGLERFYKIKKKADLVGKLIVGLAPHTSAAILGRILGFADVKGIIAHPFWHSAKRRNCLVPTTEVLVLNSNKPKLLSLEDLFQRAAGGDQIVDDFGTTKRSVQGIAAWTLNPITASFEKKKIKSVLRIPAPEHLVEVKTKSGRKFKASPAHRLFVNSDSGPLFRKIVELSKGDALMLPKSLDLADFDISEIDLLQETPPELEEVVMLRGVRSFVEELLQTLGGLKQASERIKIGKKTFSNYLYRDSIPLNVLRILLNLCNKSLDDVPDCRLAAKRDHTEINRIIQVDEHFMRLVGYYLAEGHSRMSTKSFYQISLACAEPEMSRDITECIYESFGLTPARNDIAVTISNRILYHLFSDILKLGHNAHEKRIDPRFLSLPKPKVRELLRAYFSGDGSVEKGRLHVSCSSVSEGLLRDIGFLLLRFGIFYRMKEEHRMAGGLARDFYVKKGEGIPKFRLHYLSIRSAYAKLFHDQVGFSLSRKQKALGSVLSKERTPRISKSETLFMDRIDTITHVRTEAPFLYDIEVEDNHTFLMNDFLVSANCDGDEDSIMMLMDVLLNFSYAYLPERRGGKMDAPLVVNTNLDPKEVDSEAHCMEVGFSYPLEFYERTQSLPSAKEVSIDVVENHLDNDPFKIGLTKFSTWTNVPKSSRYVELGGMDEKVDVELKLCMKIRAVDASDVARRLVDSHLIRDTYGNLRAFARQKFRCVKCNKKYRRVPLYGKCEKCGGRVILTVSRGTVEKYVHLTDDVVKGYIESDYIKQRMILVKDEISSLFDNDKVKQFSLSDFA